jgi:hypothetical protein
MAEMSSNERGDVRLDYPSNGAKFTRLWQPRQGAILETTFRDDGAVLFQRLLKGSSIEEYMADTLKDSGADDVTRVEFADVIFNKACPSCSKNSLIRYVDAYRSNPEVPVMPIYLCKECGSKSYHMTDEYLRHLVKSNPGLFEKAELSEFENNGDAFVAQLKRYIISIFASKKIKCIK